MVPTLTAAQAKERIFMVRSPELKDASLHSQRGKARLWKGDLSTMRRASQSPNVRRGRPS